MIRGLPKASGLSVRTFSAQCTRRPASLRSCIPIICKSSLQNLENTAIFLSTISIRHRSEIVTAIA
jgi:hypothetical protein